MDENLATISAKQWASNIHIFTINETSIILDVNSNSIHVADNETADFLKEMKASKGEFPIDKVASDITEAVNALIKEGTLFTADSGNEDYKPASYVKSLCLHISHDCNLRCKYCFAGTGRFGGNRVHMSLETGKKAIDFLLDKSGNRKALEIDFFGGEPLLNFNVVKDLVTYGNQQAEGRGKKITFTLTTNGVGLTDEVIEWANEHNIPAVLSLDGRKSINDEMRPFTNGKGSYETIVPKFKKLVKGRQGENYYLRGTFTKNNIDFLEDVKAMVDEGFTKLSLEPVVAEKDVPYAFNDSDLPHLMQEYEKLALYMEDEGVKRGITFFHYNIEIYKGPCLPKRLTGCGAGHEYFAVTPEGQLYPCHQFVGKNEYLIGNLYDGIINDKAVQAFKDATIYAKEECTSCWARFYCSGGCHANAYNQNCDILKPYEIGCELQRKRIECAIYLEVRKMLHEEGE